MEEQKEKIMKIIRNYNVIRKIFINDQVNDIYINNYINKIYIINLDDNIIRRKYIIKLMEKYNINFELIIVPRLTFQEYENINNKAITIAEAGCYLSHMFCFNDAIFNNYDRIIIFEDDIILHKNFHSLFQNITTSINHDILMLGACDFHFNKINYKHVLDNSYIPDEKTVFLYGTFAVLYSNKAFHEMFNKRINNPTFMDNNLIYFLDKFRYSFKISYQNLVITDYSQTNINHCFWITNKLKEDYYLKNCFNTEFKFCDYNLIYLKPLENYKIIDLSKSYAENILDILKTFFNDNINNTDIIYKRLVYDFFDTQDLNFIIS